MSWPPRSRRAGPLSHATLVVYDQGPMRAATRRAPSCEAMRRRLLSPVAQFALSGLVVVVAGRRRRRADRPAHLAQRGAARRQAGDRARRRRRRRPRDRAGRARRRSRGAGEARPRRPPLRAARPGRAREALGRERADRLLRRAAADRQALHAGARRARAVPPARRPRRPERPDAARRTASRPVTGRCARSISASPARTASRLLFETYLREGAISRRQPARVAATSIPVVLGVLLALWLVQVPLGWSLSAGCGAASASARSCCTRRSRPPSTSGAGSPATCTTASCRTSSRSRSRSAPPRTARPATRSAARSGSLRTLLVELYPDDLHRQGLDGALSDLLAPLQSRGLQTTLEVDDEPRARPRHRGAALPDRPGGAAQRRRPRRRPRRSRVRVHGDDAVDAEVDRRRPRLHGARRRPPAPRPADARRPRARARRARSRSARRRARERASC